MEAGTDANAAVYTCQLTEAGSFGDEVGFLNRVLRQKLAYALGEDYPIQLEERRAPGQHEQVF